jgi:hypothetical protein
MALKTRIISKTVTTAGARERLTVANIDVASVVIQAKPGNTDNVYVGDNQVSSSTGVALAAGDSIAMDNDDFGSGDAKISLDDIWLDVAVNGEGVNALYLERN